MSASDSPIEQLRNKLMALQTIIEVDIADDAVRAEANEILRDMCVHVWVLEMQDRLRHLACNVYGWGPTEGAVEFFRTGTGWKVGNGIVGAMWKGREVPTHAQAALHDIEAHNDLI